MATPTIAELLTRNAALFADMEQEQRGWSLILSGRIDDPDSFDAGGGKAGPLGYYPLRDASGVTQYRPCLARLAAIAAAVPADVATVVADAGGARLKRTGTVGGRAVVEVRGDDATGVDLVGDDLTYRGKIASEENGLRMAGGVLTLTDPTGRMRVRLGR